MVIPSADEQIKLAREHAWKYFELHANQRLTAFNFFLVLSGALAAGMAAALQGSRRFSSLGVALGLLLALVSFVFWKLDQRISFLIKHAEAGLTEIEAVFPVAEVQLFLQEPSKSTVARKNSSCWSRSWTYGQVFRLLFCAMALAGIVGATLCGVRFAGYLTW